MGEAKLKGGTAPLDARRDKALVTVGDMQSVQVWCDQVRADVLELCDDAEVKYMQAFRTEIADSERLVREEIQAVRNALDAYRQDELLYRNNRTLRGRLLRLKWWLLAILPFGIGACVGGQAVPSSNLVVSVDSAHHVACYQFQARSDAIACVRIDSLTVWREKDSTWVLR